MHLAPPSEEKKANSHVPRRTFLSYLGLGALAACTPKKPSPTSQSTSQKTDKTYSWKMVTAWPKNFPGLGTGANALAKHIEAMSGGRIKVKVFGAGELVPPLEIFDTVSRGTAELGHCAPYYWKSKHEAIQFFGATPFGLNAVETAAWLGYGGGQALWDNLYAPFGLKPFAAGFTGVQMGGWYNKEINDATAFKGLKIRMPGLGGDVLSSIGATVVNMPGGDLFQALQSGTIDATEWVGPYNDLAFGLYKAAKHYYWPGWHEPGAAIECIVNKACYDELPPDLQAVVEQACKAATYDMLAEFNARNAASLHTLLTEHKVDLRQLPADVLKVLAKASQEVLTDIAGRDPKSKAVYASITAFLSTAKGWNQISEEAYAVARREAFA